MGFNLRVRLDKIEVSSFKRIQTLEIELKPMTALVGGNTSGKSSALQAAQLGVSILQAAFGGFRKNGIPEFSKTVANDAVLFRPTENLLDLRHGGAATQNYGYAVRYSGVNLDTNEQMTLKIEIRRGKNANIAITREGDNDLAVVLASDQQPFSILTPGLSGISMREEWRTKAAMDAAVMHGDANLYLRTVLDHLFKRDLDAAARTAWLQQRSIDALPDESGWKAFAKLLDRCYDGARVLVNHDPEHDRFINVEVETPSASVTLDMASTGMLQVIQIVAYACFYKPPLLLLDEPDAHLHADSQSRLYEALKGVAEETQTRILFASHSPQLIQRLMYDQDADAIWMADGAKVALDEGQRPAIPIMMALGALTAGAEIFDPARQIVLMTEDKNSEPVRVLALANGAPPESLAVLSYNGCGNLPAARLLANMISDMRPDAQIIIHRDRDFRTEQEMNFELATASAERERNGITGVSELFTPFNDVEHSFAQANHLKLVFDDVDPQLIDAAIIDETTVRRDDLVHAARVAREQIRATTYIPRKQGKVEWAEAAMPNQPPPDAGFLPANGLVPVSFEHSHGKKLIAGLKTRIHGHVGGDSQDTEKRLFSYSEHLRTEAWTNAFQDD
ncbi:AAA family ATPase [Cognatiyoonia sp. IB215182]|uniref:AAA family ATPase n=1 Tax=Cognatiyoonia sp. IB215182 TaxID=3097353 RepID=UPI002A158402|nr:AAA family ATPase [Cognatiyoonia sp. IB215182]MDX8355805.1 AAA family ATPase [Cognatiyoonia sp. IB215182]